MYECNYTKWKEDWDCIAWYDDWKTMKSKTTFKNWEKLQEVIYDEFWDKVEEYKEWKQIYPIKGE